MGINSNFYVVKGYEISDRVVGMLSDEEHDDLMNNNNFIPTGMCDSGGIFGEVLFESNDGRYSPIEVPLIDIRELRGKLSDAELHSLLPFELKLIVGSENIGISTYMFICYS